MTQLRNVWSCGAVILGIALFLGAARPAHAVFQISFTTSSGTVTVTDGSSTASDGGSGDIGGTAGVIQFSRLLDGFNISVVMSTSNSPGTPGVARVTVGSLDLINESASSNTIVIHAVDQGFTTGPVGPLLTLSSVLSGTVTQDFGETSSITFRSYADVNNNLLGTHPSVQFPFATAFQVGPPTQAITDSDGVSDPFAASTSLTGFVRSASPYSLASRLDITLSGGSSLNAVSGKTEIAVPGPPAWVSACVAVGVVGVGNWWRRRRAIL